MLDRRAVAEVFHLEHLADFDVAVLFVRIGTAHHPFDRLILGLDVDDPIAGDQAARLGKWPLDEAALVARKTDARALAACLQTGAVDHDSGLDHLLVELRHRAKIAALSQGRTGRAIADSARWLYLRQFAALGIRSVAWVSEV